MLDSNSTLLAKAPRNGAPVGERAWGGMEARSAWAVGLAMNARCATEIILGVLALRAVVMALFTSLI
jgi:hypothetical protein